MVLVTVFFAAFGWQIWHLDSEGLLTFSAALLRCCQNCFFVDSFLSLFLGNLPSVPFFFCIYFCNWLASPYIFPPFIDSHLQFCASVSILICVALPLHLPSLSFIPFCLRSCCLGEPRGLEHTTFKVAVPLSLFWCDCMHKTDPGHSAD